MAYVNVCISACTYVLEIVQQQVPVKLVDAIEFNSECLTSLRCPHPGVTYTGCKTANGLDLENPVIKVRNLLTHPSDKLHTCDLFFAGWPCPPFSTLGARRGDDDIRILVFKKVLRDLKELAARDSGKSLKAFVLEYVAGATQSKAGVTSFAATVQTELATDIAPQFIIGLFAESPRDHGIPQFRTRIFFTGVNRMCMAHRAEQQLTPPGKALSPKTGFMRDFLLPNERPQADLSVRTDKQKSNIQCYRKMFDDANDDVDITNIAKCAMCDISRAPDKAFG